MDDDTPKRRLWRRIRRWAVILLVAVLVLPAIVLLAYRILPPPLTPLMVIRQIEGEGLERRWMALDAMAPALAQSVVAAEDNLFCLHSGFDVEALTEQVEKALDGERARGASTISMQVSKNLFLWPSRSFVRKGAEAWLTIYLEALLPKRRIIELYLNIVEWGPGLYGAEAAARAHFGVSAARLSSRQAALMAAVLPNPRRWSAGKPTQYISGRAVTLQRRIRQLGPEHLGCWG